VMYRWITSPKLILAFWKKVRISNLTIISSDFTMFEKFE
jgi:hypothetical protein